MNVRKHSVITALILALSTLGVAATANAAGSTTSSAQPAHKSMTHKKASKHHSAMTHKKKTSHTHKKHKTAATQSSKTK